MALFRIMAYMIEWPALAAVPFLVLFGLYLFSRKRFVLIVALFWAGYLPYELGMKYRLLCSGECNIRIDLLLIYPTLAFLSFTAVFIASQAIWREQGHATNRTS